MSTVIPQSFRMDKDMAPVFNRNIARYQIISVTFLESLDGVGSDSWDVSQARDGSVIAWVEANGSVTNWIDGENKKSDAYALYIAADNGINGKFCANLFSRFLNLKSVEFNGCFHTDDSESMENMFENCLDLKMLDLHGLKTDGVRNMAGMFRYSGVTTLDLQNFQATKVEDMSGMFENCSDLEALELRSFDTSKVKDMSSMFSMTGDLTNLNISSFDISSVTDMSFMFSYLDITELDLSHFNTPHLKNMSYMFSGSDYLKALDVRGFNTSSVTNMNGTFKECKNLETLLGVAEWDMSSVEYYNNFMDEGIKVDGKPWQNLFE